MPRHASFVRQCSMCGLRLRPGEECQQPSCVAEREFIKNKPDEGDVFKEYEK